MEFRRYKAELRYKELFENANAIWDAEGMLRKEVRSYPIMEDRMLRVSERLSERYGGAPGDWRKMSTDSFDSPRGKFQVHFYKNIKTGEEVDYASKIVIDVPRPPPMPSDF